MYPSTMQVNLTGVEMLRTGSETTEVVKDADEAE